MLTIRALMRIACASCGATGSAADAAETCARCGGAVVPVAAAEPPPDVEFVDHEKPEEP